MKQSILFLFATLIFIAGCSKDSVQNDQPLKNQSVDSRGNGNNSVTICHQTGNGESHTIQVNANAVQAHLAHGDYLGSCNSCQGVCFDEATLNNLNDFIFYYDSEVNDCEGIGDLVFVQGENFVAAAGTIFGPQAVFFIDFENSSECVAIVGDNITEAEYDCAQQTLRSFISQNEMVNFCDIGGRGAGSTSAKDLLKRLPAHLFKKGK